MTQKRNILAFDTALNGIAISVETREGKKHSIHKETAREQASLLIPLIEDALAAVDLTFQDLDAIVCSNGPGSFTGLRIGLTTAKTLGLALDIPVIGLNTLDIMAAHYKDAGNLLVVLETKRQDFYVCTYDAQGKPLCDPMAATVEEVIEAIPFDDFSISGNCLTRFKEESGLSGNYLEEVILFDPHHMVQMAQNILEEGGSIDAPAPIYLRGADTSSPKTPPRKLEGFVS